MSIKPKITYLDPEPVRYSGSTPNLSRRGGIRVHPIKDGGLNPNAHQENILRRDRNGAKLVDVVDPETGFCTGVRSNLVSAPNYAAGQEKPTRPAVSGGKSGVLKNLPDTVLVDTATGQRVYLDDEGRRIRTCDMGEGAIPAVPASARPDTGTRSTKRSASVARRDVSGAKPKRVSVPGTASGTGRITDEDVIAFIRAMCRANKKPEPKVFTKAMLRDGKVVLQQRRKQAKLAYEAAAKALGA